MNTTTSTRDINNDVRIAASMDTIKLSANINRLANFITMYEHIQDRITWPDESEGDLEMTAAEIKEVADSVVRELKAGLKEALKAALTPAQEPTQAT